jgi:hypothetical protein
MYHPTLADSTSFTASVADALATPVLPPGNAILVMGTLIVIRCSEPARPCWINVDSGGTSSAPGFDLNVYGIEPEGVARILSVAIASASAADPADAWGRREMGAAALQWLDQRAQAAVGDSDVGVEICDDVSRILGWERGSGPDTKEAALILSHGWGSASAGPFVDMITEIVAAPGF